MTQKKRIIFLPPFSALSRFSNALNSEVVEEVRSEALPFLSSSGSHPGTHVTVKVAIDQYLHEISPFDGDNYEDVVREFTENSLDVFNQAFGIIFSVEDVSVFNNINDAITQNNGSYIPYSVSYINGTYQELEAYDNLQASFYQAMQQTGWNYTCPTNDYDILIVIVRHNKGGHNRVDGVYSPAEHDSSKEGKCPNACIIAYEGLMDYPIIADSQQLRLDLPFDMLPEVILVHEVSHLWGALHQAHRYISPLMLSYRSIARSVGIDSFYD